MRDLVSDFHQKPAAGNIQSRVNEYVSKVLNRETPHVPFWWMLVLIEMLTYGVTFWYKKAHVVNLP
jgi:hypothetical protein